MRRLDKRLCRLICSWIWGTGGWRLGRYGGVPSRECGHWTYDRWDGIYSSPGELDAGVWIVRRLGSQYVASLSDPLAPNQGFMPGDTGWVKSEEDDVNAGWGPAAGGTLNTANGYASGAVGGRVGSGYGAQGSSGNAYSRTFFWKIPFISQSK